MHAQTNSYCNLYIPGIDCGIVQLHIIIIIISVIGAWEELGTKIVWLLYRILARDVPNAYGAFV